MNRRNFLKTVTGFVAGMFATSAVAKEKPKLTVAKLIKCKDELDAKKRSGTMFVPAKQLTRLTMEEFHQGRNEKDFYQSCKYTYFHNNDEIYVHEVYFCWKEAKAEFLKEEYYKVT